MDPLQTMLRPGNDPPGAGVMAPSPLYLTGEEALRVTTVTSFGSNPCNIVGRILRPDGTIVPIADSIQAVANRTSQIKILPLCEGWLLGVSIRVGGGAPNFGQAWAMFELVRGVSSSAPVVQTLGAGWFTTNTPFYVPGGPNSLPLDGPGFLRSITGSTPAAGAEISETVPTGARWELVAFTATLVSAVAVATRIPHLLLDDGANVYFSHAGNGSQPASTTAIWSAGASIAAYAASSVGRQAMTLPNRVTLAAGHRIRTLTELLQAADQWSAIQYLVREWLTVE